MYERSESFTGHELTRCWWPWKKEIVAKIADDERLTIELILHDVVEDFKKEENQVMIGGIGVKKPRSREGFEEMEELSGRHHRKRFDVRRNVDDDCQKTVEQGL